MEANVRKNRIVLSFLIAAIMLVIAFAIGTVLYEEPAEAAIKPGLSNCVNHNPVPKLISSATCQSAAKYQRICDECGLASGAAYTSGSTVSCSYSWTVTRSATCALAGSKKGTCKWCGGTTTQSIPATGRHATSYGTITSATCTTAGKQGTYCANCTYTANVTSIPALGHTGGSATCTAKPKCTRCGTSYGSALGHNSSGSVKAEAATCTSSGVKGGSYCSRCNNGYSLAAQTIPALGHNPGSAATCTSAQKCTRCSATITAALGHNPGSAATCTSAQTCTRCSATIKSALGHSYGSWTTTITATCTLNGKQVRTCTRSGCSASESRMIDKKAHVTAYGTIKAPTCTQTGTQGTYCANCTYTANVTTVSALGHNYSWTTTKNATCVLNGSKTGTCTRSGCSATTTETIPAHGIHQVYDGTIKAPTCTTDGSYGSICANCTYTNPTMILSATGHSYGNYTTTREATCLLDGSKYRTCSACGDTDTQPIKATGHTWGDDWLVGKAATCTTDGYFNDYCFNCGATVRGSVIKATGHNYSWTTTKNATCVLNGSKTGTCTNANCSATTTETIPAHGIHQIYDGTIKAPTCTTDGSYGSLCANCTYTNPTMPISATGHDFSGGWIITKDSTCTKTGDKYHVCKTCGFREDAVVDLAAHQVALDNYVVKAPTCTQTGIVATKCANCAYYTNEQTLPKTGHKWGEWVVTQKGTCVRDEIRTRECTVCSATETSTIPTPGHIWSDNHHVELAPTCTATGYYNDQCTVCGLERRGDVIDKIAHPWGEWVVTQKGTCVRDEIKTRECSSCGQTESKTTLIAPGHVWEKDYRVALAPTCISEGYYHDRCKACGTETRGNTIPQLTEHPWGEWVVTQKGTCVRDKIETRECTYCSKTETRTTKTPGHIWSDNHHVELAPTCTADGYYNDQCTVCGLEQRGDTIPRKPHTYVQTSHYPGTCMSKEAWNYTCSVCGAKHSDYGDYDKNVHELTALQEVQPTCTVPGAIYEYCSNCDLRFNKQQDLPALGHNYKYPCSDSCDRTFNGQRCNAVNPDRQEHNFVHQTKGTEHFYTCSWCGYQRKYVDPDGSLVLYGVRQWRSTLDVNSPDWDVLYPSDWMSTQMNRNETGPAYKEGYQYDYLPNNNEFIVLDGTPTTEFTRYGDEAILPVTFTSNGQTFRGVRISMYNGMSGCHEYSWIDQIVQLSYTRLTPNCTAENYRDKTVVAETNGLIGHNHPIDTYGYPTWNTSYATMDFGNGVAVTPTVYEFITNNTVQLEASYTVEIYRQKQNVSMSGNFTTDKNAGRYEYFTSSTVTVPLKTLNTVMYPVYSGYTLTNVSGAQNVTTNANGDKVIQVYADGSNVVVKLYYNKETGTLTFNSLGGSSVSSGEIAYNDNLGYTITGTVNGALPTPTRAGYKFLGWTRSKLQGAKDYVTGSSYMTSINDIANGLTLYAQWECVHTTKTAWQATTKGSCTTEGLKYRNCANASCDYALRNNLPLGTKYTEEAVIPARQHAWSGEWTYDNQAHWHACTNGETDFYTACVSFTDKSTHTLTVIDEASCTENGIGGCIHCDYRYTIPLLGHLWSSSWTTDTTHHWKACTRTNCPGDGTYKPARNELAQHTWTITTAPDCLNKGLATCSTCKLTTTDIDSVQPTGHKWSASWSTDATYHWKTCTNSNCPGDGTYKPARTNIAKHNWTVTTAPNCTTDGVATCSTCKLTTTNTATVPAIKRTGHNWSADWKHDGSNHWKVCINANCPGNPGGTPAINDKAAHNWQVTTNPTCTEYGIETCSVCGRTRSGDAYANTRPLTHSWSGWKHDGDYHWQDCTRPGCDAIQLHDSHTWNTTKYPTCTETGTRKCNVCSRTETLAATGHDFSGTWDASNANGHWHVCNNTNRNTGTACTATDGPYAHDIYAACEANACFKCADCGYVTDSEHRYSYACDTDCNDCGWTRTASHNSVPASTPDEYKCEVCSYCGIVTDADHDYTYACSTTCNNCGYVRDAQHYSVPAGKANACEKCYYCDTITDATHEYDYACDTTCNNCGYERFAEHKWTLLASDGGTCIRPSYYKQQCDYCGIVEEGTGVVGSIHEGEFLPASEADVCYRWSCCGLTDPNHEMREHTIATSTCLTNGLTEFRCSKCNYTTSGNTLPLDSTNHEGTLELVGTKDVHSQWSCCGKLISAVHNMEFIGVDRQATCTEAGSTLYRCECGYWEILDDIPARGHNPGNGDGYRAPTCEVAGETGRGYCTVCGVTLENSMPIPALGHNFIGESVNTGNGSHYFKCERFDECGAYGIGGTKNKTNACTGGVATCLGKPVCDICGVEYGSALGHSFTGAFDAFNTSSHWHICDRTGCTYISTREPHNITTREIPVSNVAPGYKYDTCECGYERKYDYTYRLIVNLDGGEWNPSGRPATQLIFDGKPGETVTLPNPTKVNHKFDGWSLTGGGTISGTTYTFGDSHGTATALWLNMFYLDLNGSLNGESLSSLVYNKDGKFTFATADIYVNGVLVADDVTDYYTMHVYGSSYRVVVTAKPGYNFNGQNTKEFTGTIGAADVSIKPAASSNTYKITIDLNPSATTTPVYTGSNSITGTWDERTSVTDNVTIPNPTMPGYQFAGWTITENGVELDSGVKGTAFKNLTSTLNGEVVFTATWKAVEVQYKVHHYLMNTDGSTYKLHESESFAQLADTTITLANDKNVYPGFTYSHAKVFQTGNSVGNNVTTAIVDADGTLNVNLYYTRNKYTVTVDPLPGTGDEVTYTQYHGTTLAVPAPTRTGYTFAGWSLTGPGSYSNGTYTFGIGDAELEAQWNANVYNIVYNLNDISDTQTPAFGTYHPATGTYDVNVTISNPTMVGYTFKGWKITGMDGVTHYYGANTTTNGTINSTMETSFKNLHSTAGATVTFTAIWEANKYNISYDLNDISDTQTPKFGTNHPTGATFDVAFTVDNPTMTGYTFAGWKITGMDGVTHFYGANTTTNTSIASTLETVFKNLRATSGTVTFQAIWTKNTYNISYNLNDISGTQTPAFGSKHPNSATFDEEFTVSAPTMVGYQFIGWEITGMDGVKHFYGSNETTANSISSTMETVFKNLTSVKDGTVTFKALWKANTYNIVYDLNDVSPSQNPAHGATHPNSATFDKTFTVSNPTMTGYTFIGWTITGMDSVTHFIGANSTDNDTIAGIMDTTFMNLTSVNGGTVTFKAMWQANTYTITLNPGNGRVNPTTITVTYDQPYGTLPTPIRIGYDFTGWYNAETNGTKITDVTSVTTPENHTLYAGWQRSTYTITYVLNGGYYDGNSTITQQYLSGTSITLITPQAPAGKTFVGWFTSYDNSTGMYSGGIGMGGDTYMLTESITVYACYVDKHDLGITVNDIYGEIKVGSQFMTSATIVNNNLMSIIPTDNLKVVMKVYVNGVVNPSMTQVFTNQIVPGKGTQLVSAVINTSTWSNSNTYQIEWSIDTSDMALYTEEVSTNNVSKTISFKPGQYRTITNTERPGYSTTRPDSFQNLTAPSTSTTRYEWTQWTWNNGGFVKLSSADQLDITLLLKPENESGLRDYTTPAFKYLHDYTTRSGYGLSIHTYFCTGCGKALGNATTCASCRNAGVTSNVQANTNIGRLEAVMTFPEFNYSTSNNNCAVLSADKVGNMYTLTLPMYADYNSSDTNDKFAHYTPMWLPDGQYTPVTYISGLWTPLGELTATVRQGQNSTDSSEMNRLHIWSNAVILDGSLYDDLYGN